MILVAPETMAAAFVAAYARGSGFSPAQASDIADEMIERFLRGNGNVKWPDLMREIAERAP